MRRIAALLLASSPAFAVEVGFQVPSLQLQTQANAIQGTGAASTFFLASVTSQRAWRFQTLNVVSGTQAALVSWENGSNGDQSSIGAVGEYTKRSAQGGPTVTSLNGTAGTSGADGTVATAMDLTGGTGGAGFVTNAHVGGAGASGTWKSGLGGAGGATFAAGAGGPLTVKANDAGAANSGAGANGGTMTIGPGAGTGTNGLNGMMIIQGGVTQTFTVTATSTVANNPASYFYHVTATNQTVTLPATTPPAGTIIYIKAATGNTGTTTIGRNSHNIDGAASNLTLSETAKEAVLLVSDGTDWWPYAEYKSGVL